MKQLKVYGLNSHTDINYFMAKVRVLDVLATDQNIVVVYEKPAGFSELARHMRNSRAEDAAGRDSRPFDDKAQGWVVEVFRQALLDTGLPESLAQRLVKDYESADKDGLWESINELAALDAR